MLVVALGKIGTLVRATGFQGNPTLVRAGTSAIEIHMGASNPDVDRRIEELTAQVGDVSQRIAAAKDDSERQALGQEAQFLLEELKRLRATRGD